MSAASELRAIGLAFLTDPDTGSGEVLTFRGSTLNALVSYSPREDPDPTRMNNFVDRGRSTIEVQKADLTSPPLVGEEFTGPDGRRHRIDRRARTTDLTYFCDCVISTPTSDS